jgi:hypothetical protein
MAHLCKELKNKDGLKDFSGSPGKDIEEPGCEVKKVKPPVCYLRGNIVKMHP